MSLFNKEGKEFAVMVAVDKDPNQDPTYSHKFPTMVGNKVVERWSTKVRPIKSLTAFLQGCQLKRNKDYMIDYNPKTKKYEYWFDDGQNAFMFSLMCGTMKQTLAGSGHKFDIQCPHCAGIIDSHDISWV